MSSSGPAAISLGALIFFEAILSGRGAGTAHAAEDGVRLFGLVDLSIASESTPEPLKREIERLARRRGLTKLSDPDMRRALDGPQATEPLIARLVAEARAKQDAGDCAAAVAMARTTETAALEGLAVDDEREPLKALYALLVACQHALGHADLARAAGVRMRTLVSLPPPDLSRALWETYVAGPPSADGGTRAATAADGGVGGVGTTGPAGPPVELTIDSDPPNARVAINFHVDGVTPRTLKLPPGVVYLELEKTGYKKAFRVVTLTRERGPTRVVFRLADRREDRAAQVESAVVKLRGSDPTTHPTTLARLAELARVDVLVAIAVSGAGTVKLWWFDSDRGDLIDDPVESPFDPRSGKLTGKLKEETTGKLLRSSAKDPPRAGGARAGESAPPP